MGNYPDRWPVYGTVDEDQQWVIDRHLEDAEQYGISVFAVNWYRDDYQSYPVERMKASASASATKWCVQWSNHYNSMSPTESQKTYLLEGVRRAGLHMGGARYWTKDGKPVLMFFSATHLDDVIRIGLGQPVSYTPSLAERTALVVDIKNVIGNVLAGDSTGGISGTTVGPSANPGPYLVLMTSDSGWAQVSGIDALTAYNARNGSYPGGIRHAHSFRELEQATELSWATGTAAAKANGKKWWPTVMSGWDRRAWGGTESDPLADNCQPETAEFERHCRTARGFANNPTADRTVFLYAWNELGEGGWVMETNGPGTSRLEAVKSMTT